jgi:hypothetical protein
MLSVNAQEVPQRQRPEVDGCLATLRLHKPLLSINSVPLTRVSLESYWSLAFALVRSFEVVARKT